MNLVAGPVAGQPHRVLGEKWQFEPDLAKSSEAGPLCGARATNDLSEASDKVNGRVSICGLAVRLHTEEA